MTACNRLMVQSIPRVSPRTLNISPSETGNAPPSRERASEGPRGFAASSRALVRLVCCQQFSSKNIACEQALLFGQAKQASRESASEDPRGFAAPSRALVRLVCCQQFSSKNIACEQALLFGQAKRASRERASEGPRGFAARSRAPARLVSLAQIGELARRLLKTHHSAQFRVQMSHHGEQKKINSS